MCGPSFSVTLFRSLRGILGGCALLAAIGLAVPASAEETTPVTIFAAASTTNAINEIAALYGAAGHGAVRPVFAASSTLAKQIDNGAPADLYLSANVAWMDFLAERGVIAPDSRVNLLSNRLVLIAPGDRPLALVIQPGFALAAALGDGRLALGDPAHVPAGVYAKAALEALGVWQSVAHRSVFAANVRAALALIESGAAAAGIVYRSDAAISRRVQVVGEFPANSHPPIAYPLAMVAERRSAGVERFYAFLLGPEAAAVFARHGFLVSRSEG